MDSNKRSANGNPYLGVLSSKKQKLESTTNSLSQNAGQSVSSSDGYSLLNNSPKKEILSSQLSKILKKQPQLQSVEITAQEALQNKLGSLKDKEEPETKKQHPKAKTQNSDDIKKKQRIEIMQQMVRKNRMLAKCLHTIPKADSRVLYPEQPNHPFIVFAKNPNDFGVLLDMLALFYHQIETSDHYQIHEERKKTSEVQPKQKRMVVGFDCEFVADENVIGKKKAGTIQLSTAKFSVVFWVAHLEKLPESLEKVLKSKKILKVGVNSHDDAMTVMYSFGCPVEGVVDINYISLQLGFADSFLKLGELAKLFVKDDKFDTGGHQKSWKRDDPTPNQIRYAGHDAWLGFAIVQKFYSNAIATSKGVAETMHKLVKKQVDNAVDEDVDKEAEKTFYHWLKPWNLTQEERDYMQKDLSKTANKGTFEAVASIQKKLVQDESEIHNLVKTLAKKAEEEKEAKPKKKKKTKTEEPATTNSDDISLDLNIYIA